MLVFRSLMCVANVVMHVLVVGMIPMTEVAMIFGSASIFTGIIRKNIPQGTNIYRGCLHHFVSYGWDGVYHSAVLHFHFLCCNPRPKMDWNWSVTFLSNGYHTFRHGGSQIPQRLQIKELIIFFLLDFHYATAIILQDKSELTYFHFKVLAISIYVRRAFSLF